MWHDEIETTSLTHARRMSPMLRERIETLRERHRMRAEVDAWQTQDCIATLPSLAVLDRRRAAIDVCDRRLHGIACKYNRVYWSGGEPEMVLPGAFTETLADGHDVVCLANHRIDTHGDIIAKTRDGTLRLWETDDGLSCAVRMPRNRVGNEIMRAASDESITGMSIGLRPEVKKRTHIREALTDTGDIVCNIDVDVIHRAYLGEVTIVLPPAAPANKGTRCRRLRPGDWEVDIIVRRDELAELVV